MVKKINTNRVMFKSEVFHTVRLQKERALKSISPMDASLNARWLVQVASKRRGLLPGRPAQYWEALQVILESRCEYIAGVI